MTTASQLRSPQGRIGNRPRLPSTRLLGTAGAKFQGWLHPDLENDPPGHISYSRRVVRMLPCESRDVPLLQPRENRRIEP